MRTYASKVESVKTFANQSKMPRLPIPPLEQTTRKYLKTLEPLLSVEDLAKSRKFVEDFTKPGGLGETLQGRLVAYEKEQKVGSA